MARWASNCFFHRIVCAAWGLAEGERGSQKKDQQSGHSHSFFTHRFTDLNVIHVTDFPAAEVTDGMSSMQKFA